MPTHSRASSGHEETGTEVTVTTASQKPHLRLKQSHQRLDRTYQLYQSESVIEHSWALSV
jgi:hypothetical protein